MSEEVLSLYLEENDFFYRIRRSLRIVYVWALDGDIIPHDSRTESSRALGLFQNCEISQCGKNVGNPFQMCPLRYCNIASLFRLGLRLPHMLTKLLFIKSCHRSLYRIAGEHTKESSNNPSHFNHHFSCVKFLKWLSCQKTKFTLRAFISNKAN